MALTVALPLSVGEYFTLPPSDWVLSVALTGGGGAESFVVPANARFVLFSASDVFYANYTTTATVPGDVTDGTASELNPTARLVGGVAEISVIAPNDCVVTAAFYV